MILSARAVSSFSQVDSARWDALHAKTPGATVFQSFAWLSAWWGAWGAGEPLILLIEEGESLVGGGAFFLTSDRTLKFVGDEHADYGDVLTSSRQDVLDVLLQALTDRASSWCRLALDAVRVGSPLYRALRARGATAGELIPCPAVDFKVRPVGDLLGKASLRRHERALAALGKLRVLSLDTAHDIEPWLEIFFQQHCERWALTETPSLFLNERNERFYRALAAQAKAGGAVVFTVILVGDRPAAMHFGFKSQGVFIWYKPSFDPRLAAVGPGEVLLAELLRYSEAEGLTGFDFTRGGEGFKRRFATVTHHVTALEAFSPRWRFWGAHFKAIAYCHVTHVLDRQGWREPLGEFVRRFNRGIAVGRKHGVSAVLTRAYAVWRTHRQVPVRFYLKAPGGHQAAGIVPPDFQLTLVTSIPALLDALSTREVALQRLLSSAARRLKVGDTLLLGTVAGCVVAYGWCTRYSPLKVTEVSGSVTFTKDVLLLYDFNVIPAFRGQGYYPALLCSAEAAGQSNFQVVYARADNTASLRGIERAGFRFLFELPVKPGTTAHIAPCAGSVDALPTPLKEVT